MARFQFKAAGACPRTSVCKTPNLVVDLLGVVELLVDCSWVHLEPGRVRRELLGQDVAHGALPNAPKGYVEDLVAEGA
eukprot:5128705-Pyramimonas_sp.AAC.1